MANANFWLVKYLRKTEKMENLAKRHCRNLHTTVKKIRTKSVLKNNVAIRSEDLAKEHV